MKNNPKTSVIFLLLPLVLLSIGTIVKPSDIGFYKNPDSLYDSIKRPNIPKWVSNIDTVHIHDYFRYLDSLVVAYDSLTNYPLSEHLLVRANPWIMDTLANTDYYRLMQRDSFVYDQKQLIVLRPADSIFIPDAATAYGLIEKMNKTHIDINIPEFKLRIYEDATLLYTFPIRVGQNRKRYLKMGDRITDLRTKTGKGEIVDYRRDPFFYNPVDGKRFYRTKRDDDRTTMMPQIPWIETEINGMRNGQLIHPTTNPKSLGKAYSNGCIGTRESDAWIIYYHAPIGTKITIRYDLKVKDSTDTESVLKDIYAYGN
ncbi:L,D-transpeptidase [Maribacter aestuarii]|uniref:L,D-transpeptidase n=1 Tax=Maribacter aestuarii TaxID=1130723 RepID=UPI00248B8EBD|nr:L,D-transpeptidase [Maribacter aestuarii]